MNILYWWLVFAFAGDTVVKLCALSAGTMTPRTPKSLAIDVAANALTLIALVRYWPR